MAEVNPEMVKKVAGKIKELSLTGVGALDFTEKDKFPSIGDLGALNYFFAVTMHDYGFWIGDEMGYVRPIYGVVNEKRLKGSDLLWTLSMKVYKENGPEFFNPDKLSELELDGFYFWLPDEYGFQDIITRYNMAANYGKYCVRNCLDPETLLDVVNHSTQPLKSFLDLTQMIPGYDKDVLLKKNLLLAMILTNRPEKFLKVKPEEKWLPIVDYHLMRVALRLGLVDLTPEERSSLMGRLWITGEVEIEIRSKVFEAILMVINLSGKPMSEIDFLLWSARKYCPEMTEPDCPKCVFTDACQKRAYLFQPVLRTTNY